MAAGRIFVREAGRGIGNSVLPLRFTAGDAQDDLSGVNIRFPVIRPYRSRMHLRRTA